MTNTNDIFALDAIIDFYADNLKSNPELEEATGYNAVKSRHTRLINALHRQVVTDEERIKKWGNILKDSLRPATAKQISNLERASDAYDDAQHDFLVDSEAYERAVSGFEARWGEAPRIWANEQKETNVSNSATAARLLASGFVSAADLEAMGYGSVVDQVSKQPNAIVEQMLSGE